MNEVDNIIAEVAKLGVANPGPGLNQLQPRTPCKFSALQFRYAVGRPEEGANHCRQVCVRAMLWTVNMTLSCAHSASMCGAHGAVLSVQLNTGQVNSRTWCDQNQTFANVACDLC